MNNFVFIYKLIIMQGLDQNDFLLTCVYQSDSIVMVNEGVSVREKEGS